MAERTTTTRSSGTSESFAAIDPALRCTLIDRAPGAAWWATPTGQQVAITVQFFRTRGQWCRVQL